jgi:hypothetical protein
MIICILEAMRSVVAAAVIGSAAAFAPAALPTAGRAQGKCDAAPAPVPSAVGTAPAACDPVRELLRAALRATATSCVRAHASPGARDAVSCRWWCCSGARSDHAGQVCVGPLPHGAREGCRAVEAPG